MNEELQAREAFTKRIEKELRRKTDAIKQIYSVIKPSKDLPATGKVAEILAKVDDICEQALGLD